MDDISDIREMYDASGDREDDRLRRHQLERDITWRYLDKYLPHSGSSLLEIGAATGRYTLELARRGYDVLAIDLSSELTARAKTRAIEAGFNDRIEFRVDDIRTVTDLPDEVFDGALVMGPMYHLVEFEERKTTLDRVFRTLKPGGIIISSWISRYGIWGDIIKRESGFIFKTEMIQSVLDRGRDPEWYRCGANGGFRGYFAQTSEIPMIHEESGFQTLGLVGVEPCIAADDASYNTLEGEQRRLWLDLLFKISSEPSMVASSRHMLYIGKKVTQS